jgi:hypothetical protein
MTFTRAWASVFALAVCRVLVSAFMAHDAMAQDFPSIPQMPAGVFHFELAAQRLTDAIKTYGQMTSFLVMADTNLLNEHTSAPVNGDYSPQEALQRMLAGTGLDAQFTDSSSVVIVPLPLAQQRVMIPSSSRTISSAMIDGANGDADYAALVQSRLTDALCQSSQTRPGNYRLIVQIRFDASGAVIASKLVGSTGSVARDAAIAQVVRTLSLDAAPPTTLAQPVTVLLRPQDNSVASGCAPQGQG